MNKIGILALMFFICLTGFAQTDTIFSNNQKISCKSIKIKTDSITYKSIGTEISYSIAKKEVDKIIYKNGKVFSVKEDISLKHIDGVANFNDVVISFTPSDTSKCIKIHEMAIPFNYGQSGDSKYREKIYRIFRMNAAMRGANLVYIPEQIFVDTDGLIDSSITQLYGTAYASNLPSFDAFEKKIGEKNEFNATEQWYMPLGKKDVYQLYFSGKLIIDEITEQNGFISITGELKGFPKVSSFQLIAISSKFFTINFISDNNLYNVRVEL